MPTQLSPVRVFVPVSDFQETSICNDSQDGWVFKGYAKEQELFCFSKEELVRLLRDAFDAGFDRGDDQDMVLKPEGNIYPDKEQYISELLKQ